MKTLQKDNYKKIRITTADLNENLFKIDGVTGLAKTDGTVSFFYKGDINAVLKLVSSGNITDLSIEDPTLEEIFMHYYE